MKKTLLLIPAALLLAGCGSKFPPASQWQTGQSRAVEGEWSGPAKVSFFQKFKLPKEADVIAYLEKSGLKIGKIQAVAFEDTDKARVVTYQVFAMVPSRLFRMSSRAWNPREKDLARFGKVLVFNPGLPAGEAWDTQAAQVAAEPGKKITFMWKLAEDKVYKITSADALVFGNNLFTEEQVREAQSQTASAIANLEGEVARIKKQVADFKSSQMAGIPGDPPKPQLRSKKWGGSGSGEPTKTAVRGVGGAATGAAIGGIAAGGDGAAIGAGAGFLGGIIYDAVSKSNDREKFEKEVEAENSARLSEWNAQKRELAARRSAVEKDARSLEDRLMSELEARIAANSGRIGPSSPTYEQQPGVKLLN